MRVVFVVGGMSSGKSAACKILAQSGLPYIDFDKIGHAVLLHTDIQERLIAAFGKEIAQEDGTINRHALAQCAFANPGQAAVLMSITMPAIAEIFSQKRTLLDQQGYPYAVTEASAFKSRKDWFVQEDDIIVAITAPQCSRIERAVKAGWDKEDYLRRRALQPTDEEYAAEADIVFTNASSTAQLKADVLNWWHAFKAEQ